MGAPSRAMLHRRCVNLLLLWHLLGFLVVGPYTTSAWSQTFGPWYVAGPFAHPEKGDPLDVTHGPELELRRKGYAITGPDLTAEYVIKGPQRRPWLPLLALEGTDLRHERDSDILDLRRRVPPPPGVVGWTQAATLYLYQRIDVTSPTRWTFVVGADDRCIVWIDGIQVAAKPRPTSLTTFDALAGVELAPGVHHVTVKLVATVGYQWRFRLGPPLSCAPEEIATHVSARVDAFLASQTADGRWSSGSARSVLQVVALVRAGLEPEHPAVEVAIEAALAAGEKVNLASAALVLAGLELESERLAPVVDEHVATLVARQDSRGLWGRGQNRDRFSDVPTMEDTFWAALALDAAVEAGRVVPSEVWLRLAEGLVRLQAKPKRGARGDSGVGFRGQLNGEANTVATARGAALAALVLRRGAEALPAVRAQALERVRTAALLELDSMETWGALWSSEVVDMELAYGLALLARDGVEALGGVALVPVLEAFVIESLRVGRTSGYAWYNLAASTSDLLAFATLGGSGAAVTCVRTALERHDFALSVRGRVALELSIPEVAPQVERAFEAGPLDVARVEVMVRDDEEQPARVLASVAGGAMTLADLRAILLPVRFAADGVHWLELVVTLDDDARTVWRSAALRIRAVGPLDPARLALVRGLDAHPWRELEPTVEASSSMPGNSPVAAFDGSRTSNWWCAEDDLAPSLRLRLRRPVEASGLRFSHAEPYLESDGRTRAARVEVRVNGKVIGERDLDVSSTALTRFDFGGLLRVTSLELRVVAKERRHGVEFLGFSEIDLLR